MNLSLSLDADTLLLPITCVAEYKSLLIYFRILQCRDYTLLQFQS